MLVDLGCPKNAAGSFLQVLFQPPAPKPQQLKLEISTAIPLDGNLEATNPEGW